MEELKHRLQKQWQRQEEIEVNEIRASVIQIREANLTDKQIIARLLKAGFTESQIQEIVDGLMELGYNPQDYTRN
ncbi:hypothetical protein HYR99_33030 [Candidatus Poribacteria bacterium]|nr:hypothetical protein [Candidatus Poribacteria bacterium]